LWSSIVRKTENEVRAILFFITNPDTCIEELELNIEQDHLYFTSKSIKRSNSTLKPHQCPSSAQTG